MTESDDAIGIGGPYQPPAYVRFYFEAARRLLESESTDSALVAIPIAYLQRHCLELAIKELHLASIFLADAKSTVAARSLPAPSRPPEHHNLVDLADSLQNSLRSNGLDMPAGLSDLAREMDALEGSSPDRYRYAFARHTRDQKKNGHGPFESFPDPKVLPLLALQRKLAVFATLADLTCANSLVVSLYSEATRILATMPFVLE